jgi:TPR repeat protein
MLHLALLPVLLVGTPLSPVTQAAVDCVRKSRSSSEQNVCLQNPSIPFLEMSIVMNEIRRLDRLRLAPNAEGECPVPADEHGLYEWHRFIDPAVLGCLLRAAETGRDLQALEWAQFMFWEGRVGTGQDQYVEGLFPRNEARLRRYIDLGVARGAPRSILAKAAFLQDVAPVAAHDLYRQVAVTDDCRGQLMLAWMYLRGLGGPMNPAKAYFWARLGVRSTTDSR